MPVTVSRERGRRRTISEINMVPFIDVMLVLLIIFMVTAPLIAPSVIDLPSAGKASRPPDVKMEIIIGKDESLDLKVADKAVRLPLEGIVATIIQAQAGQPPGSSAVVISADKSVKYETVVKAMNQLKRSGIERVGLSVQTTGAK